MTTIEKLLGTREFTGWHMLGVLFLFFGTIISVNLVLAWFAATSWTGLVVKNSYVASQEFNEVTAERRRGAQLGWKSQVSYKDGIFSVTLSGRDGKPAEVRALTAMLGRPATNRDDQLLLLTQAGGSTHEAAAQLGPGMWQADLTGDSVDGTRWFHSVRFMVREPAK